MPASKGPGNLPRFLKSATPTVPSRTVSRSDMRDEANLQWHPLEDKEKIEYFELKDLWESYEELSAFGVETSVTLNTGESIKQYYIPYLSAIQIYTASKLVGSPLRSRREGDRTMELESESLSDDSGSSESDLSRSVSKNSSNTWDYVSEDFSLDQGGLYSSQERFGNIYLEFFETCSLHLRLPFADQMKELMKSHAELKSLTSLDVCPASWMAVAWYPIYHIPNINEKDLSTCFLTYHTLSSTFLDDWGESSDKISLFPFGIATYKMHGDLWIRPKTAEHMKFMNLQNAASSWLKQLNVHHHDSSFFSSRSRV